MSKEYDNDELLELHGRAISKLIMGQQDLDKVMEKWFERLVMTEVTLEVTKSMLNIVVEKIGTTDEEYMEMLQEAASMVEHPSVAGVMVSDEGIGGTLKKTDFRAVRTSEEVVDMVDEIIKKAKGNDTRH